MKPLWHSWIAPDKMVLLLHSYEMSRILTNKKELSDYILTTVKLNKKRIRNMPRNLTYNWTQNQSLSHLFTLINKSLNINIINKKPSQTTCQIQYNSFPLPLCPHQSKSCTAFYDGSSIGRWHIEKNILFSKS